MRTKFDLDLRSLERFTVLFHGAYGAGKTALLGDMLRYEAKFGPVKYLNIAGEDGQLSIANFGLGNVGETVDTLKDFNEAIEEYRKENLRALAVDGGKWFGRLCIKDVCGDRLPKVGGQSDDWTQIHSRYENTISRLRHIAPIVAMASSSDRSMDQISGNMSLTPDMPGRQAAGCAGLFDFVLIVKAEAIRGGVMRRTIETEPVANTIIRQRLPKPLPPSIEIPNNGGGWKALVDAMQNCLNQQKEVNQQKDGGVNRG